MSRWVTSVMLLCGLAAIFAIFRPRARWVNVALGGTMNPRIRSAFFPLLILFQTLTVHATGLGLVDEIVVTASRTPVPANAVGSSVTVITREEIEQRQYAFVSDLLDSVPGVDISRLGPVGTLSQVRVRGGEANQTLVLIDGVEANDVAQDGQFNFAHLQANDVERIEVLRGAQSSIWGADALSGVINVITRKGAGKPRLSIFGNYGSFSTTQGGGSISGAGENYNFALNGSYYSTGGINIAEVGDEDDGYENGTVTFRGGYVPTDNSGLDLVVRYTDTKVELDPSPFPAFIPADGDDETDTDQLYSRVQAHADFLDGHWEHLIGSSLSNTDNENFSNGIDAGSTEGRKFRLDYQTNVYFDTPEFASASHTLTFLVDRELDQYSQRGAASFFGNPNQDQSETTIGYAIEYRLGLWDRVFLSGAVRWDDNDKFDNSTTGRGTAAYDFPQHGTRLRASYGTGVKNPTFTERFGFFPDTFAGNPGLSPERSESWDVGIEQRLFDDRLFAGVTYFSEDLEDEINGFVFDPAIPPFGGFTAANVDGTSERDGVEFILEARPLPALTLTGSYTYLDATEPDLSGSQAREIRRPKNTASLVANLGFLDNRANVNFSLDYTGEFKDNNFAMFPATVETMDSFVIINVATSYRINNFISIFGRVENLADENYQEVFGFETPGIAAFAGIRLTPDFGTP